jgi:hypothetical protein
MLCNYVISKLRSSGLYVVSEPCGKHLLTTCYRYVTLPADSTDGQRIFRIAIG